MDCLYVTEASILAKQFEKIIRRAMERKIPVISQVPESSEKGALVSLEANPSDMGQQAADVAVKVLSGKKPSILSIISPRKVDLFINMKTAKMLELNVPLQVLNLATKVIK
jgi:putative ABC transport system substrate-binding protein